MYDVLLLDDNPLILRGLRDTIDWSKFDMRVCGAYESAEEALEAMARRPFDVALVDIELPGMTGLAFARLVQAINADLQLIIISAYGEFSFAKECIEIGVKRYLLKPVDTEELECVMRAAKRELDERHYPKSNDALFEGIVRANTERLRAQMKAQIASLDQNALTQSLSQLREFFPGKPNEFVKALGDLLPDAPGERAAELASGARDALLAEEMITQNACAESGSSELAVKCAARYIEENYMLDLRAADVAAKYHLQPTYFSALFRKQMGDTFSGHLNRVRMERATRYLRAGYNAGQTAEMVGYRNYKSFYKAFKKYWGSSPAEANG